MSPTPRGGRVGDWLLGAYVIVCAAMLTWPGYAFLGNRIEPLVLGLPFSLVWVIGWVALTFVVLVAYHSWKERS